MNIPQIIYVRPRNTQQTFRKLSTSPTKYTANTPLGVGADSSRPYLPSINSVSVCHHFRGVYIYAGTINRPLQLLTDCDNACEHSANYLRSPTKYTTNTPLNAENRFIVPVYFCCHFIYCSKPNRRNQKQATLKITNKDRRIIPYTQFAGKILYKASDLERLLENNNKEYLY